MSKLTASSARQKGAPRFSLFLRFSGTDAPAAAVAHRARQRGHLPVTILDSQADLEHDYCLVDGTLAIASEVPAHVPVPAAGLGYAGFSAEQRAALYSWSEQPVAPAPPAFQQILLANAEVRLLEGRDEAERVHEALVQLSAAPAWQGHPALARTLLLSFWLRQDGAGLAQWLASFVLPPDLWRLAAGQQAMLQEPLTGGEVLALAAAWQLPVPGVSQPVIELRLDSLRSALGADPLAYALGELGGAARADRPWRCQHRDLRLALPQPDLRPRLEPLLREMLAVVEAVRPPAEEASSEETGTATDAKAEKQPAGKQGADKHARRRKPEAEISLDKAHLILEFGASRSDVFDYVLRQAQKQPGFQQLMDENRHIVYRVPFRRGDMRHFWQIWSYVQNWSSTHVYSQERELEKWQIYPYSQYLR